ncbi:MAG: type II toxin-antitoxin system VapC family toxin [Terriglobia bacterium]
MAHKYVLDTHALVWHLEGNPRLGQRAKGVIDDPTSSLVLPIIALAEAAYIVEHRRTSIPNVSDLLRSVSADLRISIQPMTWEVFQESLSASVLPEMHDRLIVGSALHLQSLGDSISLLTKDASIVAARLVTTLW